LYDDSGLLLAATAPAGGICSPHTSCWKSSTHGYEYRSRGVPAGITRITLRTGTQPDSSRIAVKAGGPLLALPDLATLASPVTAEVRYGAGACWAARYTAPFLVHDATHFRDTADVD